MLLVFVLFPRYLLLFVVHLSLDVVQLFFVCVVLVLQVVFLCGQLFDLHHKVSENVGYRLGLCALRPQVFAVGSVVEVVGNIPCLVNGPLDRIFVSFVKLVGKHVYRQGGCILSAFLIRLEILDCVVLVHYLLDHLLKVFLVVIHNLVQVLLDLRCSQLLH